MTSNAAENALANITGRILKDVTELRKLLVQLNPGREKEVADLNISELIKLTNKHLDFINGMKIYNSNELNNNELNKNG